MSEDQGSSELEEWRETTSGSLLTLNPDPPVRYSDKSEGKREKIRKET